MFNGIDFFSDTITRPSRAMKQAMMDAEVGDEQKGEDPTTKLLEEKMAIAVGTTSAMFFPSATMCNQVAAVLHCQPGDEVIGAEASHLFTSEGGGIAAHARAQARTIPCEDGQFDGEQVKRYARFGTTAHTPKSALLVVENTMNGGGGSVWPLDKLRDVLRVAGQLGLKTHLDGARIFNAASASKKSVVELAQGFDTVTVCFSKGLGCPTGAILGFDQKDWEKVRRLKQVFGGAMRQSGILAAACLYALENNVSQLEMDHGNARLLSEALSTIQGIVVENPHPQSNMVYFSIDERRMTAEQFLHSCANRGLRFSQMGVNRIRAVTHRDVSQDHVDTAENIMREIMSR